MVEVVFNEPLDGTILRLDPEGRIVWSPDVDRLREALAKIADLGDVRADEAAGIARRALDDFEASAAALAGDGGMG